MDIFKNLENLYTYNEYSTYVSELLEIGLVTGDEQTEGRKFATNLNIKRMNRIAKHTKIDVELESMLKEVKEPIVWYVISEGWCGDAAQNLPIINMLAEKSEAIELKIVLRDQNPEVIDQYLTNGGRAIPKLIAVNKETEEILGTWGPRPAGITALVQIYKAENPEMDKDLFNQEVQLWYGQDKGKMLQADFKALLEEWNLAVCPSCD